MFAPQFGGQFGGQFTYNGPQYGPTVCVPTPGPTTALPVPFGFEPREFKPQAPPQAKLSKYKQFKAELAAKGREVNEYQTYKATTAWEQTHQGFGVFAHNHLADQERVNSEFMAEKRKQEREKLEEKRRESEKPTFMVPAPAHKFQGSMQTYVNQNAETADPPAWQQPMHGSSNGYPTVFGMPTTYARPSMMVPRPQQPPPKPQFVFSNQPMVPPTNQMINTLALVRPQTYVHP